VFSSRLVAIINSLYKYDAGYYPLSGISNVFDIYNVSEREFVSIIRKRRDRT
jgi:hypothetical protein